MCELNCAPVLQFLYLRAIVEDNILGKPTQATRQRSAKRLAELYATDPGCTVFRLFRQFWKADNDAREALIKSIAD